MIFKVGWETEDTTVGIDRKCLAPYRFLNVLNYSPPPSGRAARSSAKGIKSGGLLLGLMNLVYAICWPFVYSSEARVNLFCDILENGHGLL